MIIGFLVPHRCDHPALGNCTKCNRGFCEEHMEVTPQGLVCLACQQGLTEPVALPQFAQSFTPEDIAAFSMASTIFEDDRAEESFSDLS